MVPNSMTVAAIFKSRLLKMAAAKKKKNHIIFVIKLKLQVTLSM